MSAWWPPGSLALESTSPGWTHHGARLSCTAGKVLSREYIVPCQECSLGVLFAAVTAERSPPSHQQVFSLLPNGKKNKIRNQKFLFLSKHHHSTFGISPHIIIPKTYVLHKNNLALSTITSGTMLVIYRIQSQLAFSLGDSFSSLPRNTINNRGLWTKIQNKQNICIMSLYAITYAVILSNQRNIILQTATKTVFNDLIIVQGNNASPNERIWKVRANRPLPIMLKDLTPLVGKGVWKTISFVTHVSEL